MFSISHFSGSILSKSLELLNDLKLFKKNRANVFVFFLRLVFLSTFVSLNATALQYQWEVNPQTVLELKNWKGTLVIEEEARLSQLTLNIEGDSAWNVKQGSFFSAAALTSLLSSQNSLNGNASSNRSNVLEVSFEKKEENNAPPLRMILKGPSVALKLWSDSGQVQVKKWSKSIFASILKGQIDTENTSGSLRLSVQEAKLNVSRHKASDLRIEAYQAKMQVREVESNVQIQNFNGSTFLEKIKGPLRLKMEIGKLEVHECEGEVNFSSFSAHTLFDRCKGLIQGASTDGPVTVKIAGDPNLNIESEKARIRLQNAQGTGATVNAFIKRGEFSGPSTLHVARAESGEKKLTGRLKGSGKGQIKLRTGQGSITIE